MAFESLSERIQMSLRRVTGRGMLNERDIDEMMREIRLSLLEADVNYKVVRAFTEEVKAKALGEKILKSLSPGDQVVKVVHDELKALMGEKAVDVIYNPSGPSVFLLAGLQGSGKTTQAAKLARFLKKRDARRPLLVAADVYRPAAIEQLQTVGAQVDVPVFTLPGAKPAQIVREALKAAKQAGHDLVIIDTAGRLHIDDKLMEELIELAELARPDEIFLTIDAMMGQDAINVIQTFNEKLPLTGCLLTKLDGDTRGGAALSIRYLTNVPIKFIGIGEKLDELDVFHPDRMASRILGMGDVVTLVEKASANIEEDEAKRLMDRLQQGLFDYNDFYKQLKWLKRLGSLKGILKLIPGMGEQLKNVNVDDKQLVYVGAIIASMTAQERRHPELISRSPSRRARISKGSGRSYQEVNKLVRNFELMKKQLQTMSGMSEAEMHKAARRGDLPGGGRPRSRGKGRNKGRFRY